MIQKKTWEEFRATGLLLIINQLLHVFGWAIVCEYDDKTHELVNVYPARVKFRGFDEQSTTESYKKVTDYMIENAKDLKDDLNY